MLKASIAELLRGKTITTDAYSTTTYIKRKGIKCDFLYVSCTTVNSHRCKLTENITQIQIRTYALYRKHSCLRAVSEKKRLFYARFE
jgi:hypothetical protein